MIKNHRFSRTEQMIGKPALAKLSKSKVAVFGIGGVGAFAAEALARSSVGTLVLVDDDLICETNVNRQLLALSSTIGKPKVEVMRDRIMDINPGAVVETIQIFYLPGAEGFSWDYDYVVDAVDTVSAKLSIISECKKREIPIISVMGAGNKLDPTKFEVADIYETSVCSLAKVMRHELKKRAIASLKVVYSKEQPIKNSNSLAGCKNGCICPPGTKRTCAMRRQIPASISFVPPVAGFIAAGEVIKDLVEDMREELEFPQENCSYASEN
ncbi:MAG: tRNA threonylcarbamoyladenosine dehydratase [Clostridiales bacterium]|jgi:tRNA A37 threonylcarbamoyladenosine dehydratase|nr:tRNA threonylcarbamoyladenosine dehydratase [Clostridiales bacterium]